MAKELLLVLYSRPGCHLCEVAKEALQPVLRRYRVRLEERNVENDPAWERDYGHQVPVGMIGDRKLFKYRIDPRRLECAIQARLGRKAMFRPLLILALSLPIAAQALATQVRSAAELHGFSLRGGGEGVLLDGWADHTIIARTNPDGSVQLVCLQGDEHIAAALSRRHDDSVGESARDAPAADRASAVTINATLVVDPEITAGADAGGRVLLYTPDPIEPGSSRSHFDPAARPNLLMEPFISPDLSVNDVDLSKHAMRDMGWRTGSFDARIDFSDGPGAGFNDAALGEMRRAALQFVVDTWQRILGSSVTVNVETRFREMTCSEDGGAVLASAGPRFVFRDVPGGLPGVWYPGPLAESLASSNLSLADDSDPVAADLVMSFNSAIDNGCLGAGRAGFYYGLDDDVPAGQSSFITVALHEMAHGLGFTGLSDLQSGRLFQGAPDIFTTLTYDNKKDKTWDQLTDGGRRKSAVRTGEVAFAGDRTRRRARRLLEGSIVVRINSPRSLADTHVVGTAAFGPPLDETGVTADLVLVDDATASPTLACAPLINADAVAGKIAVLDRGDCFFVVKVKNAQDAGAVGVIVVNNVAGSAVNMGGDDGSIDIPSVMVDRRTGARIKRRLTK